MPQIPINPFDNDRLKTRKVQENLAGLGALPSDRTKLPTFLRSRRAAAVLIDRALEGLAPNPMLSAAAANNRAFAAAVNAKFTAAFSAGGSGGGGDWPLVLDFVNGSYASANTTYALADVWEPDTDWFNGGDLSKLVPGVGIVVDQSNVGIDDQGFHFSDLFSELVSAGPIVVFDFNMDAIDLDGSHVAVAGYDTTEFNEAEVDLANNATNRILASDRSEAALPALANGDHKVAILMSNTRIAASLDGAAVVGLDNVSPTAFSRIAIQLYNVNAGHSITLRSATFRDPAEGESVLPTLSAL